MKQSFSRSRSGNKTLASREVSMVPAGIAIVAVTYGLSRYAFGLFLPQIQMDLGVPVYEMGIVAGSSYAGYLLATVFGSWISAHTGPRMPVLLGGLAATVGMLTISLADSILLLASGVIIAGASPGLAYPPISDAVVMTIDPERRSRVYAWINCGTGVGVAVAAPFALWAGESWRSAWLLFAVLAACATVWNSQIMPNYRFGEREKNLPRLSKDWFWKPQSRGLLVAAILFGLGTSVYWTFSVNLLVTAGALSMDIALAFWICIGLAGLTGGWAANIASYLNLKNTFIVSIVGCAGAVAVLPVLQNFFSVMLSGAIFGATFIIVTAVFGIWSMQVFEDRPSAGFGLTFLLISIGQLIGPIGAGFLAEAIGMGTVFWLSALLLVITSLFAPRAFTRRITGKSQSNYS